MRRLEPSEVLRAEAHVTQPYSRVSFTSAFSTQTFRLKRAAVLSYNSDPNRLKHAHAGRICRSISNERSALPWKTRTRYIKWLVCLYLGPAAPMTSGGAMDAWPGVGSNIVSVFLSDTVPHAAAKTVTMTAIILASPFADVETISASSVKNMSHTAFARRPLELRFRPLQPRRGG